MSAASLEQDWTPEQRPDGWTDEDEYQTISDAQEALAELNGAWRLGASRVVDSGRRGTVANHERFYELTHQANNRN